MNRIRPLLIYFALGGIGSFSSFYLGMLVQKGTETYEDKLEAKCLADKSKELGELSAIFSKELELINRNYAETQLWEKACETKIKQVCNNLQETGLLGDD